MNIRAKKLNNNLYHYLNKFKMKKHFFIVLLLSPLIIFSQNIALDTSFYSNGCIKSILFEQDIDITGYQVEVFYSNSHDLKKIGNRIADTIYEHQPKWPIISKINFLNKKLIRICRNYLPDSSYIEKHLYIKSSSPNVFSFSSYTIYFYREKISICYNFSKVSKPTSIYVSEWNFSSHKKIKAINEIISNKSIELKNQVILLTKNRKLWIENFDSTMYLSKIVFQDSKGFWDGSYIEFNFNAMPKVFGYYMNKKRTGHWYDFYPNGNVKEKGQYSGIILDEIGNAINLKNNNWYYYDELGNITKKEKWKNGKLISRSLLIQKQNF